MSNDDIETLKLRLREFADERDWDQFHSPKNLSMALSVEASELLERFYVHGRMNVAGGTTPGATQWLTEEESIIIQGDKLEAVRQELADIPIYLIRIADKLNVDLLEAVEKK